MELFHTETDKLTGVTYAVFAEQDDIPVRGNAMASGDDELDAQVEEDIITRLEDDDIWGWATVRVEASIKVNGVEFTGEDYLGGCSYSDVTDFIEPGGYYDGMKGAAFDALVSELKASAEAYERLKEFAK